MKKVEEVELNILGEIYKVETFETDLSPSNMQTGRVKINGINIKRKFANAQAAMQSMGDFLVGNGSAIKDFEKYLRLKRFATDNNLSLESLSKSDYRKAGLTIAEAEHIIKLFRSQDSDDDAFEEKVTRLYPVGWSPHKNGGGGV